MASTEHEAPLALLKEEPGLVYDLLRDKLPDLPYAPTLELAPTDLTQLAPVHLHADLVLLERDAESQARRVVVFEVQLARDPQKLYSWPMYAAALHHQHRCEVLLVVFAPDSGVAQWASRPISTFQRGGFAPVVLSGAEVPWITSTREAQKAPGLAVFSAVVHGGEATLGEKISQAAWLASESLPEAQRRVYQELIYLCARHGAQEWMEFKMDQATRESLIVSMHNRAFHEGHERGLHEGHERGLHEGHERGLHEGHERGLHEGKAEGKAEALFALVAARGFTLTEAQRARISACHDLAQLDSWITLAVRVSSPDDLFA